MEWSTVMVSVFCVCMAIGNDLPVLLVSMHVFILNLVQNIGIDISHAVIEMLHAY